MFRIKQMKKFTNNLFFHGILDWFHIQFSNKEDVDKNPKPRAGRENWHSQSTKIRWKLRRIEIIPVF